MDNQLIGETSKTMIQEWGYVGVFTASFLAADEAIMPFAGFLSGQGMLHLPWVVLLGSISALLGSLLVYGLARWVGEHRLRRFVLGPGRYLFLQARDVDAGLELFRRYGPWFVFLSRFFPVVRNLAAVPAGLVGMPLAWFSILILSGCLIRNTALCAGGYLLGTNWEILVAWLGHFGSLVSLVLVLFLVFFILKRAGQKL